MNQPATFIPENAPFDAGQRLWLNGYMAGLLAGSPAWAATLAAALSSLLVVAVGKGIEARRAKRIDITIE